MTELLSTCTAVGAVLFIGTVSVSVWAFWLGGLDLHSYKMRPWRRSLPPAKR